MWPQLNERQRRALLGAEARELGWGGVAAVAKVAGVARSTVSRGMAELDLLWRLSRVVRGDLAAVVSRRC